MADLRVGSLFVDRETKLLVEVVAISGAEIVLEYDDDGAEVEYSVEELHRAFEPWVEGMEVVDRTGKGRFTNPGHPDYRPK